MAAPLIRLGRWLFIAVTSAGFAVCVSLFIYELVHLWRGGGRWGEFTLVLVGSFALFWALVTVHELGHLVAAWSVRFHVLRVVIGPVKWVREGAALRLRWNRSLYGLEGLVLSVPTDDRALRPRVAWQVAGGPLANVAQGGLCLAGMRMLGFAPAFAVEGWIVFSRIPLLDPGWWLYVSLLLNGILCFGTLLPTRGAGVPSDGAQLLDLLGGSRGTERNLFGLVLQSALMSGVRPRAWSAELVERLLALRDHAPEDVGANNLGYYHALDVGQLERARELLDLAVTQSANLEPGFRTGLLLEAAYFYAFHLQNLPEAQKYWQQARGGDVEQQSWLRAEAALLFAEGRYAEAASKAEAGLTLIPQSWDPGGSIAEKEWLEAIVEQSTLLGGKVREGVP